VTKVCLNCKTEKQLDNFYQFFNKWSDKHYSSARCKPCHQKYKQESPTTARNRKTAKLKLRYGLTYEQWEKMRETENYACMICGITESEMGKKLDVDHCHSSGKVRGVLCNPCNNVLGVAKDRVEILKAAIDYLETNANGYQE